jgi:hypothetical protein
MTMKALNDYLASIGVTYLVRFVPQSKSRNRANPKPSINWLYTLKSATGDMRGPFFQGIGHAPHYHAVRRVDVKNAIARRASEYGTAFTSVKDAEREAFGEGLGSCNPLPTPDAADIVNCLLMDANALDYTFEYWCSEFGYDEDSRSAERAYNDCVQTARDLDRVFTSEQLAHMRGLLEGY